MNPAALPLYAEIDLRALDHNFRQVRRRVGKKARIMAVVKADAYGHGMLAVAGRLRQRGVDYLGVARPEEAVRLREAGVRTPLVVLNSILPRQSETIVAYDLIPVIGSREIARALAREAARRKKKISVHLKIDTGMGRGGIWHEEAIELAVEISRLRPVRLTGIATHFSSADTDPEFTLRQLGRFRRLIDELEKKGIHIPERHAANSVGVVDFRNSHLTLVRPGLMLYGFCLRPDESRPFSLKPVLSLKAKIVLLKKMGAGRPVSYGRTYVTSGNAVIAVVPVGYADGYFRCLSNRAQVLVRGRRAPVVGRICMDQMMVDVGHVPGVKVGDEVVLIGRQRDESVSCRELAELAGTIPYEILTAVSPRLPRIYRG